ncbi:hypothetical protein [Haladaptatus caseinilyticus]|uniref:hypothetical protein n=1 Tax=Haladaptatus caseinilyticus TaxID=2993314 RepID=UPI00224AD7FB|nr:hypothetical protein [Haladaptatus caseinilyticus]
MHARGHAFDRIRAVISKTGADDPLTAREILSLLNDHDEEFESAHEIATVLGRQAQFGDVTVIRTSPYQYELADGS